MTGPADMRSTLASLDDAREGSYWMDRPEHTARPLHEPITADIGTDLLVVGAGLTGLWAALEAARDGRDVVLVDSGRVGAGASGRCGGFINASITHGIPNGHLRWPGEMEVIVGLQRALWDDTLKLVADHGHGDVIDPVGKLTVATTAHHHRQLIESAELLQAYDEDCAVLDGVSVQSLVRSPTYVGGLLHTTANGLCDPVRLAATLADIAVGRGVRIAEHSAVVALDDVGGRVCARTSTDATITARQVLLATNAYPPLRRRLRARVIPVYDHVITTEPLSAAQRTAIGWDTGFGIVDAGNQFHYYRRTPDDRILFGGWDATYHFGGRVDERFERRGGSHALLARHLVETFPALDGVAISHVWGGPIDSTSRFTPMFDTAMGGKLGWAVGFTGLGVGASRFGALAALDLLAGVETDRTRLTMVQRQPVPFPPEPLRWPIIQFTKRALQREDRTGRPGLWLRLLDRLGVGFDT